MSRKHPLKESLSENSGPPTKRCRFDTNLRIRLISSRQDSISALTSDDEEVSQPSFRIIRSGDGKRKKGSSIQPTTDENDITELTRRFKKARLRPVFFTISSFIEQTVGDVQITVGDEDTDTAEEEASSTFTFILPPSRRQSDGLHYNSSCSSSTDDDGHSHVEEGEDRS